MKVFSLLLPILSTLTILKTTLCDDDKYPGLRLSLSDGSLSSQGGLIPSFFNNKSIPLGHHSFDKHIDFLGTVHFNITSSSLRLSNIDQEKLNITMSKPSNIALMMSNLNGTIDFNYTFHSNFYDNEGPGVVRLSNIVLNANVRLFSQKSNASSSLGMLAPGIEIVNFTLVSADMDIDFGNMGDLEKIVKYLVDTLSQAFFDLIKNQSSEQIAEFNTSANQFLSNLSLIQSIPNTPLKVKYPLKNSPWVKDHYLSLDFDVEVYGDDFRYSGKHYELPTPSEKEILTEGYLNQFFLESLLYSLYRVNKTNVFLPSELLGGLTTNTLSYAIPPLAKHYNESRPVDINLTAIDYIYLTLDDNTTELKLDYKADFIVRASDLVNETAFTADVNGKAEAKIGMHNGGLFFIIESIKVKEFKVTHSNIGEIKDDYIATVLNTLLYGSIGIAQKQIDEFIEKIKLPTFFNKTNVVSHDGYMKLDITPVFGNVKSDSGRGVQEIKDSKDSNDRKDNTEISILTEYPRNSDSRISTSGISIKHEDELKFLSNE